MKNNLFSQKPFGVYIASNVLCLRFKYNSISPYTLLLVPIYKYNAIVKNIFKNHFKPWEFIYIYNFTQYINTYAIKITHYILCATWNLTLLWLLIIIVLLYNYYIGTYIILFTDILISDIHHISHIGPAQRVFFFNNR